MKKILCLAVILVSIAAATPASAQAFGELFPLTNTRYEAAVGTPRLAANGRDFMLFWSAERKIRATSLANNEPRLGHVVLNTNTPFDVAWTGEVFLVTASRATSNFPSNDANVIGRLLDAEAQPLGDEFLIAEHGREPRIAVGPEAAVIVYRGTAGDTRVLVRGRRGESIGTESFQVPKSDYGYAVATNGTGFVVAVANAKETRTINMDRQGRVVSEDSLPYQIGAVSYRELALATNGKQYLLAWCTQTGGGKGGMLLDENGSFGSSMTFGGGFSRSLSAAWTGDGWSVAFEAKEGALQRRYAFVSHLDPEVTRSTAEEKSRMGTEVNPSMAVLNGRVMVAWSPVATAWNTVAATGGPVSVAELPLAERQPRVATYAATQQKLLATASSADGTLMVWTEHSDGETSIHTGMRTNDGQWTERKLATDGAEVTSAIAASDGTRFAVIVNGVGGQKLIRLDEQGRLLSGSVRLPGFRSAISWNGKQYAIVTYTGGLEGRLLSASGALSAAVAIPYNKLGDPFSGDLFLASNGDGFLLAGETADCHFGVCGSRPMKAMRLDAALQRIDAEEIVLDAIYAELAGAVWNGSDYRVAWRGSADGLSTARVPAAAGSAVTTAHTNTDIVPKSIAMVPDGTLAVVGPAGSSNVTRVAFLRNDGGIARSFDIDSSTLNGTPLLATVPDGVAYVASSVQDAAPHHGTSHIMMAISRPSVTARPDAPRVTAHLHDGNIVVGWSASAGTVNGFRIEYRIDNGLWSELEEWFPPSAHHGTIRAAAGTQFEVRMRAFNDGGVSAYSETTSAKPIRRRATGH